MAVTDSQLDTLCDFAYRLGVADSEAGIDDRSQQAVWDHVFAEAENNDMRTEDEYDAIITPEDLPAYEDWRELLRCYLNGHNEASAAA